jgi:hypothetical protein
VTALPAPFQLKKVFAVNDNSPTPSSDYERGRKAGYRTGWKKRDEQDFELRELKLIRSDPRTSLLTAIVLTIFGGLFALVNFLQWYRWSNIDFWATATAIVPLTIAFFIFKGRPKAKRRAAEATKAFNDKWGTKIK